MLGVGRSPGEGNGNPLQFSCLENPKDRGAWQAAVHSVTKSQTQLKQLSIREITNENLLYSSRWGERRHNLFVGHILS